jgi:hypothetical protein
MDLACCTCGKEDRGKEPLERSMSKRGDNIEMVLRMGGVVCINMAACRNEWQTLLVTPN